jgi:hypothetical protein
VSKYCGKWVGEEGMKMGVVGGGGGGGGGAQVDKVLRRACIHTQPRLFFAL